MGRKSKWEYLKAIYQRYHQAERVLRQQTLDEFCPVCGYHRKYAIRLLKGPPLKKPRQKQRRRICTYGPQVTGILSQIWEAAGYPWSVRLKALLPLWMPWAKKHFPMTPKIEAQFGSISPRTIDLRLKEKKRQVKKNLYGRTKPGSLLKHHIPIKTDCWDVTTLRLHRGRSGLSLRRLCQRGIPPLKTKNQIMKEQMLKPKKQNI